MRIKMKNQITRKTELKSKEVPLYKDLASACLLISKGKISQIKKQINENKKQKKDPIVMQQALIFLKQSEFLGRHTYV